MATKKIDAPAEPKRLNRTVSAGDALGRTLDPVFRKRGFASRDLLTHWAAMTPAPFDAAARPDKLVWPRGDKGAEGATLYLRVAPAQALALAHSGPDIAAAINRYFGYYLVAAVRQSAMPLSSGVPLAIVEEDEATPEARAAIGAAVAGVEDEGLRDALATLGRKIAGRSR